MNNRSNFSWEEMDKLNRQEDAKRIINFLKGKFGETLSFSININAEWGYGKTRLLEGIQHELQSGDFPHLTVYFDAWKNDLSPDPLGNFVVTVTKELLSHFQGKAVKAANATLRSGLYTLGKIMITGGIGFVSRQIGDAAAEQIGNVVSDFMGAGENSDAPIGAKPIDDAAKVTIESFNQMMKDVESKYKALNQVDVFRQALKIVFDEVQRGNQHMLPIFILIDELDRCKPTYAIELLECTKHLFSTEGVYFIFATNTEQLCHTICKVYGENFDARKYLRRFFDLEYNLYQPDYHVYAESLFDQYPTALQKLSYPDNWTAGKSFAECMAAFDVPPREQLKIFNHIQACCNLIEPSEKIVYPIVLLVTTIFFRHEELYKKIRAPIFGTATDSLADIFRPLTELLRDGTISDRTIFDGVSISGVMNYVSMGCARPVDLRADREQNRFSHWLWDTLFSKPNHIELIKKTFLLVDRCTLY